MLLGGETPAAHYSGGDDETETEDQTDHLTLYNCFPTCYNSRTGLPKGDFSFGENELDMELDDIRSGIDFRNGFRGSQHIIPQQQDWTLPNEAFSIRHEILDRSPPPDHFQNHNSPDINEDTQTVTVEDHTPGLLTVSVVPKKSVWDPGNIVVDALKYHANMGDIQTAACILVVLGEHRRFLGNLDEMTQEHWLLGYIELLTRYKLWNVATQVRRTSFTRKSTYKFRYYRIH